MPNFMFEVKISNVSRNNTQTVAGKYGTFAEDVFTGADCPAGTLVKPNGELPMEGYSAQGLTNKSAFYMVAAADGTGTYGDHTGIYFSSSKDVDVQNGYALGIKTLGLTIPAGERGAYTECIVGETYAVGADNFNSLPNGTTNTVATIVNGKLTPADAAPEAGTGVYFELAGTSPVNQGVRYWGERYYIRARRTAEATAEAPAEAPAED